MPAATQARIELAPLFAPASIAVVGASPDEAKPGGRVIAFLRRFGYPGLVYPINPRHATIAGLKAYASVEELPQPVDLVILVVAAEHVPASLEAAGRRGARSAIVLSSGFREAGPAGAELERELVAAAQRHAMAVLGPNCLGYVDVEARIPATFTIALQAEVEPSPGPIAFVSQSGAMGAAIFGVAQSEEIGLGMFASTGNEALIGVREVLAHVARYEHLSVLLGYVEGLGDGRAFVDAVRQARALGKDVALLKAGITDAGRRAAASHTGAMAGSGEAWEAAFRRCGAVRARSPRDLLDSAVALATPRRPAGGRVGIVSMSGGAGVLMADRALELGLAVPELADGTRARLAETLPGFAALCNPVDYGGAYGNSNAVEATVRAVAEAPEIDMVLVFVGLSPGLAGVIEQDLAAIAEGSGKPLVVAWLGGPPQALRKLRALGVPAYDDPMRAVEMAAVLRDVARPLPPNPGLPPADAAVQERVRALLGEGRRELSEHEVKELLAGYGIPVVRERLANSAREAAEIAAAFGCALAVKAHAPGLLHKSDAGAVLLDVAPASAAQAYEQVVTAARRAGVCADAALVAEMAPSGGVELLVGARFDEQFGPLIVVGAGGVTSEVDRDVRVELAPVDAPAARAMLAALRLAPLLEGFRGAAPRDVAAAAAAIAGVSRFAADAGEAIAELDLNPMAVYAEGEGCAVLDAAAILGGA